MSLLQQTAPQVTQATLHATSATANHEVSIQKESLSLILLNRVQASSGSAGIFAGMAGAAAVIGGGIFLSADSSKAGSQSDDSTKDRWWLIVMSCLVQMVAGSVYAMGAWQDSLRDALGTDMSGIAAIGAATFAGSVAAMLGGLAFDKLGPKASVTLGATAVTIGYLLIGLAVVAGDSMPAASKLLLAALGSMMAGYSSVSLLDNVVCMACSLSFPSNRAAIVGYLKAVLATAAGLWALLWVHIFKAPHGPGLPAYIAFVAMVSLVVAVFSLSGLQVLPDGSSRRVFNDKDQNRLLMLIAFLCTLAFFNVGVSFCFSQKMFEPTTMLGLIGVSLACLPVILLSTKGEAGEVEEKLTNQGTAAAAPADGLDFATAAKGIDFWLLWLMQFAVFGGGVATNQNLALILESAGNGEASGLGVALFALTSSLSRIAVGILSDKYSHVVSRFNWMTIVSANAVVGQFLVSIMSIGSIMLGTLLMGLSFGSFFTVIVPIVNEMYGRKQFGVIMGSQLASQAAAAFIICFEMLPTFYSQAAGGASKCLGPACYRTSFLIMTGVNIGGLAAAVWLQKRNKDSMPVDRDS
eukprot:CAMPEP_0197635258 /NCGR_PEP_ID=MMETSP1338-20131121/11119_1 /TAXON_ID=43686 ORGANISM="Pelagodinium beii, Strain RCC1491" /NCGR_SAMPLE_ID=MMETSP1338 /ASSEMBLY_ACC=CAM_ASM_000754 /LENGTH=579 /DNA_ID=CAMNT_0043207273 /DNA_START=211 /DNA_END=1950 /DNA_ORIENTATION=-